MTNYKEEYEKAFSRGREYLDNWEWKQWENSCQSCGKNKKYQSITLSDKQYVCDECLENRRK